MYMMFEGYVFVSDNEGTTWTETSFAQVSANPNDAYRMYGQKMAVDPNNPDIVYVGTPQNGLFVTTNGGTTWQSVSGVPVSQSISGDYPGITGIEFDPANTNIIFAASYGNGVYETTNAGASWTLLSGGPTSVQYAAISSTGVYYVVADNYSQLWSYANGVWTEVLAAGSDGPIDSVAVDPSNPNEIIAVTYNGNLDESLNGGATWGGWSNYTISATDIPWQTILGTVLTDALAFNPLVPNELLEAGGNDFYETTVPQNINQNTIIGWNSQGIGIEQLCANDIIVPPGGNPVLLLGTEPSFMYPVTPSLPQLLVRWRPRPYTPDGRWTTPHRTRALLSSLPTVGMWGVRNESAYSTNGGQSWTPFPTYPPCGRQRWGNYRSKYP